MLGRGEVEDNEKVLGGEGRWRMTKICWMGKRGKVEGQRRRQEDKRDKQDDGDEKKQTLRR